MMVVDRGGQGTESRMMFDIRASLVVEVSSWAQTGAGSAGSGRAASATAALQA